MMLCLSAYLPTYMHIRGGISRDRLSERLHEILRLQANKIDHYEFEQFVDVCFDAVLDRHRATHHIVTILCLIME